MLAVLRKCPKCSANISPKRLTRHLRSRAGRAFRCSRCGVEIQGSSPFKVLLPLLEKHRLLKPRKKKLKIFNPNPKSAAEARIMDFASQGKKPKSVRTISGGTIESNRRRH